MTREVREEHQMKREVPGGHQTMQEEQKEHLMRPGVKVAAEEVPRDHQTMQEEPKTAVEEEESPKKLEEAVVAESRSLQGRQWC